MNLLYLTILLPLLGFLLLSLWGKNWSEKTSGIIGVTTIGLAGLVTLYIGICFFTQETVNGAVVFQQYLWSWIATEGLHIPFTLRLDGLSFTMLSIVVGVGFLIHLYSTWYMKGEEGFSRFFAYTNLFIASMLILVLADNLLVLYLGWEGVGLCSYLLIGFYYKDPKNSAAALKAFLVTRVGDVFLAIALFILYHQFDTLNIQALMTLAAQQSIIDSHVLFWATLLLLGGAVGKSAQLPLQTWLADAMAGPTPVSALIHAATMVTAGVYLIARMNGLFLMSPQILELVGIIGAITLVMAGFAALVQTDIKRVLAYSTMSQLGYMFLALGVHAWDAAIFHLMTHAFFKALLFLSSGSVILACHHEQNIEKMGGLYKKIPLVYLCFLVGGGALAAFPFITAGFYSKDAILWQAYATGHTDLLIAGLVGAFLTALYTFRLIMLVFHGVEKTSASRVSGVNHTFPLIILLLLSTALGAMIVPPLAGVLPSSTTLQTGKLTLEILSGSIVILGIIMAVMLYRGECRYVKKLASTRVGKILRCVWFNGWGFDWLYDKIFVIPFNKIAQILRNDPIDCSIDWVFVQLTRSLNCSFASLANGKVRWYMTSVAFGALLLLILLLI